jgi:uncharacterized protein involved in outer membrane biogenesis
LRDLLTGLAILLLVCLTGALVAPHVIDWDSRRAMISARLSEAAGQEVKVEGPISLELLPTPTLKLSHIQLGENGAVQGSIGRFRLRLAIPPLLRGEFRVTEALLQGGDLLIATEGSQAASQAAPAGSFIPSISIDKLVIQDSRLRLGRPGSNEPLAAERVDGQIEVASLAGPFRGVIGFDHRGMRRSLRFSTARLEGASLRLKALLDNEQVAARTEFDGVVRYANGAPSGEGKLAASGNAAVPLVDGTGQVIWRFGAKLKANGTIATLDELEFVLGNSDRQTVLNGNADIDLARTIPLRVNLSTKQVDLDRLLAVEGSQQFRSPESLIHALQESTRPGAGSQAAMAERRGELELTIGSVLVGGDLIVGPQIQVRADADGIRLRRASGELPGRTTLKLEGHESANAGFAGHLSVESRDLAKLSAWYHGVPVRPIGLRSMALQGDLRQDAGELGITNASLVADDTRLEGSIQLKSGAARPRLTLQLTADQLDITKLPEIPEGDQSASWDMDLSVEARRVRLGGVGAGNISFRFRKEGDESILDMLRITNLGGANLSASGVLAGAAPKLEARLQATQLDALLGLADRLSAHGLAPILAARASALSPADLTISLAADKALTRQKLLTVKGTVNATEVDATVRMTADGRLAEGDSLALAVRSASPAALIRQIGLEAIPVTGVVGVDLRLTGGGVSSTHPSVDWTLRGAFGGLSIDGAAKQTFNAVEPLTGRIKLAAADLSPLAQTLLVAVPAVTPGQSFALDAGFDLRGYRITLRELDMSSGGAKVRGEITFNLAEFGRVSGQLRTGHFEASSFAALIFGEPQDAALAKDKAAGKTADAIRSWGAARFNAPVPITLPGDLWIEADSVSLGDAVRIDKPRFVLRFENGLIYIDHAEGGLLDGRLQGQATLRRNQQTVSITGRFGLEGWHLERMALLAPEGGLRGRASAQLDLSAMGESPMALVTALTGTGRLNIQSGELQGLSHGALEGILKKSEADFAAVSRESLTAALQQRLTGMLRLPSGATPLSIGAGIVRAGPLEVASPAEVVTTSLALDLKDMSVLARTGFVAREAPKGWTGPLPSAEIILRGPAQKPVREIDVSSLANGLTAIAIARETERIEALEQDQRERSFFNRRLRASDEQRRAEEERRRLEAARKLAEEQRRRDEAARREPALIAAPPIILEPPLRITPPAAR